MPLRSDNSPLVPRELPSRSGKCDKQLACDSEQKRHGLSEWHAPECTHVMQGVDCGVVCAERPRWELSTTSPIIAAVNGPPLVLL
jgi:hypothetical protein